MNWTLPLDLPWQYQASLLLDGVSLVDLRRKLYEWSDSPEFEPLYLQTAWEELSDISPCLIQLSGSGDPLLSRYLEHIEHECGYLLFSSAPWQEQINHLRWLISVTAYDEELLLRLADPAVFHALLQQAEKREAASLMGPFELIVIPDVWSEQWHTHHRLSPAPKPEMDKPYRLSDEQITQLGEVSFRQICMNLDTHMQQHFPYYCAEQSRQARRANLTTLANEGYSKGYSSEADIVLYANIFGLLGEQALDQHPDIAHLLATPSAQTPSQRVHAAADLAYAKAQHAKRNSHV